MISKIYTRFLIILFFGSLLIAGCNAQAVTQPSGTPVYKSGVDVQVVTYYFPNWGPVDESEWGRLKAAKPQFEDHQQPKVPLWGYENENLPSVMARKIEAAASHGIDAFIFDWYYYDPASSERPGGKYLYKALEEGFLGSENNSKLKFAIMWCNHDVGKMKGAVQPSTFEEMTDYIIEKYFKHPSYWKINGCPYFSIYQFNTFLETFGNDYDKAAAALEKFRTKVKAAGFPGLHLNGVLWGLKGGILQTVVDKLKISSTTTYVWIHHNRLPDFPATEYSKASDAYFKSVEYGGASNGLEAPANKIPVPYHINVSMGWDSSPRCRNAADWMTRRDYPFGPVIVNNTPYLFKKYLPKQRN
jgi:hypothetical protein